MTKKVKAALIGLGVVAGIALTQVGFVTAATTDSDQLPRGVQAIVEKFNLNKDEVVQVLEEDRAKHRETMKAEFEEKLTTLVREGKLTEAQKNAIVAKHNEMETKRTEDREQMRALHEEFQTWLKEQGIEESLLIPEGKRGMRGSGYGRGIRGER